VGVEGEGEREREEEEGNESGIVMVEKGEGRKGGWAVEVSFNRFRVSVGRDEAISNPPFFFVAARV